MHGGQQRKADVQTETQEKVTYLLLVLVAEVSVENECVDTQAQAISSTTPQSRQGALLPLISTPIA